MSDSLIPHPPASAHEPRPEAPPYLLASRLCARLSGMGSASAEEIEGVERELLAALLSPQAVGAASPDAPAALNGCAARYLMLLLPGIIEPHEASEPLLWAHAGVNAGLRALGAQRLAQPGTERAWLALTYRALLRARLDPRSVDPEALGSLLALESDEQTPLDWPEAARRWRAAQEARALNESLLGSEAGESGTRRL